MEFGIYCGRKYAHRYITQPCAKLILLSFMLQDDIYFEEMELSGLYDMNLGTF